MKKFAHYLLLTLMCVGVFGFISCDDDDEVGYSLDGTWEGRFAARNYNNELGYTRITFTYDDADPSRGTGVEYDDFYTSPNQRYRFDWRVSNGVIHLTYPTNEALDCSISNYSITDTRFSGTVAGESFYLTRRD